MTPELANKVIRADLKNIIDKVGAGKPLNGVERNLFDGLRLKTEDIGAKRQMALLGRWSNGKRLNKAELLEIRDLLPEGTVIDTEPEEVKTVGRNGYLHTYAEHAERYGVGLRTVKRWVAVGREKDDECPLDDPEGLYAWLNRHVKRSVPEGVLQELIAWRREHGAEAVEAGEPEEEEDDGRADRLGEPVGEEEMGLAAALSRLEMMEVRLSRLATDPGGTKPWLDTISRMTSVSTKLREEMEKLGQLLPKEMVEGFLIELVQPVEQGVRGLYAVMCSATGVAACPKAEDRWNRECDRFFGRITKGVMDEI